MGVILVPTRLYSGSISSALPIVLTAAPIGFERQGLVQSLGLAAAVRSRESAATNSAPLIQGL